MSAQCRDCWNWRRKSSLNGICWLDGGVYTMQDDGCESYRPRVIVVEKGTLTRQHEEGVSWALCSCGFSAKAFGEDASELVTLRMEEHALACRQA